MYIPQENQNLQLFSSFSKVINIFRIFQRNLNWGPQTEYDFSDVSECIFPFNTNPMFLKMLRSFFQSRGVQINERAFPTISKLFFA